MIYLNLKPYYNKRFILRLSEGNLEVQSVKQKYIPFATIDDFIKKQIVALFIDDEFLIPKTFNKEQIRKALLQYDPRFSSTINSTPTINNNNTNNTNNTILNDDITINNSNNNQPIMSRKRKGEETKPTQNKVLNNSECESKITSIESQPKKKSTELSITTSTVEPLLSGNISMRSIEGEDDDVEKDDKEDDDYIENNNEDDVNEHDLTRTTNKDINNVNDCTNKNHSIPTNKDRIITHCNADIDKFSSSSITNQAENSKRIQQTNELVTSLKSLIQTLVCSNDIKRRYHSCY